MRAGRFAGASGELIISAIRCRDRRSPYLPSVTNTTNLGIRGDHHLPQVSDFPQILDAWQLLLVQAQIDRVQPLVEVAYYSA